MTSCSYFEEVDKWGRLLRHKYSSLLKSEKITSIFPRHPLLLQVSHSHPFFISAQDCAFDEATVKQMRIPIHTLLYGWGQITTLWGELSKESFNHPTLSFLKKATFVKNVKDILWQLVKSLNPRVFVVEGEM